MMQGKHCFTLVSLTARHWWLLAPKMAAYQFLTELRKSNKEREETTVRQLLDALQSVPPAYRTLPGYQGQNVSRYELGVCMDEVYPGIYIGDLGAAKNIDYLQRVGITHVLNTAQGEKFGAVNTNANYYKAYGIQYLGLELMDFPSANISQYFDISADFIEDVLRNNGKVLVHCFMGISRSSTITTAFLMKKRGMTAVEALTQLRKNRSVCPNDGFLKQLADFDNALAKHRSQP